jgi:hypothetical protein
VAEGAAEIAALGEHDGADPAGVVDEGHLLESADLHLYLFPDYFINQSIN